MSVSVAHEPMDVSTRTTVYQDKVTVVATLGVDGAKQLLTRAGLPPQRVADALRAQGADAPTEQPATVGANFCELKAGETVMKPVRVRTLAEGMEVILTIVYPRPATEKLGVRMTAYAAIPGLHDGPFLLDDDQTGPIDATLLSTENPTASFVLPRCATALPREKP